MKNSTGFEVDICIYCESEELILTHLSVIRAQVKKEIKRRNGEIDLEKDETILITDENCYGEHSLTIKETV
jgi:hypothetical protein